MSPATSAVLTPRGKLGALLVNAVVLAGVERLVRADTLGTVLAASERTGEELADAVVLAGVERFEHVGTLATVLTASERTGEEFADIERCENADVRSWLSEVGSRPSRQASS